MHILTAFEQMLGGLCGGDAPGWQIDQIIFWEDKVRWAVTCADIADAPAGYLSVVTGDGSGLPAWHLSCLGFLRCFQSQEREADRLRAEAVRAAEAAEESVLAAGADDDVVWIALARAEAARHRETARKHGDWLAAAREARVYGSRMLTGSLPRHQDAASGLAAAGGAAEVYRDTHWAVPGHLAGRRAAV